MENQHFNQILAESLPTLLDYVNDSQSGNTRVLEQAPASALAELLQLNHWIKNGQITPQKASDFLKNYLDNTQHLHHPQYIGHQVAPPHLASGLADLIHGIISNPMAIYEMGPAAATIEQTVINWMLSKVGWFKSSDWTDFSYKTENGAGVMTHGGSMANLTALSAARSRIAPEAWTDGTPADLVVLAPSVSHYSVARAISIMGMGSKSVVPVAVDANEVMITADLERAYAQALSEGKRVMCVIGNACATSTGLYDPLEEIADFCEKYDLWFHVDGAHGASALLSDSEKHWMRGASRADSMIWDTHKMMRTSTLAAAVLFKNSASLERNFQQKGDYIFHEKEALGFDLIPYTIECTKAGLATKLFWVLAAEGEQGLGDYVRNQYELTREIHALINAHTHFNCPYTPQANILCFQYIKYGTDNDFQLAIRNELTMEGDFYITSSVVNGVRYLRLTVINELTNLEHIEQLIQAIERVAKKMKG